MTAEEFEAKVGRPAEKDDLARANCTEAGAPGHMLCGVCEHGMPLFACEYVLTGVERRRKPSGQHGDA